MEFTFTNNTNQEQEISLFNAFEPSAPNYKVDLPYASGYPASDIVRVISSIGTSETTLSAAKTREELVGILDSFDIGKWSIDASTAFNTFYFKPKAGVTLTSMGVGTDLVLSFAKLRDIAPSDGYYAVSEMTVFDGFLYGVTTAGGTADGVIFKIDQLNSTYSLVHDFAGSGTYEPRGALLLVGGLFYGTAYDSISNNGTLYSFNPTTNSFSVLKDMSECDGRFPGSSLVQASDGKLYGVASAGGDTFNGIIFSYDIGTNTITKEHSFSTAGAIPFRGLLEISSGVLCSTTSQDGTNAHGTIYTFDIYTKAFNVIYNFEADFNPYFYMPSSLVKVGSKLYGGTYSPGYVYSFDLDTNVFVKIKQFNGPDGVNPSGKLVDVSGVLYGIAGYVIFSVDTKNNDSYQELYQIQSGDGFTAIGGLTFTGSKFYGTTTGGGANGFGTIFSY